MSKYVLVLQPWCVSNIQNNGFTHAIWCSRMDKVCFSPLKKTQEIIFYLKIILKETCGRLDEIDNSIC